MNELQITFDALVAELRNDAASDADFAKRVALVCADLADRASAEFGRPPGALIRDLFRLV